MRSSRERLLDIVDAAERIARYVVLGEERFREDELVQVWMLQHLQNIGEAAGALPAEVREQMPHVPWTKIVGMRNMLVHQYFGIDMDVVWRAVSRDVPALRDAAELLLQSAD